MRKNERIGELEVYVNRKLVGVIDLLAGSEVKRLTFWQKIKGKFKGGGASG
ncbi:MAG: hypothetical protein ACOX6X_02625 [Dethiobacteria bacterium]